VYRLYGLDLADDRWYRLYIHILELNILRRGLPRDTGR
jgi:hypothetical protein